MCVFPEAFRYLAADENKRKDGEVGGGDQVGLFCFTLNISLSISFLLILSM